MLNPKSGRETLPGRDVGFTKDALIRRASKPNDLENLKERKEARKKNPNELSYNDEWTTECKSAEALDSE